MAKELTFQVTAPHDFELRIPRHRKLTYQVAVPEIAEAPKPVGLAPPKPVGLVLFIRGFGEDNSDSYASKMRTSIMDHGSLTTMALTA